MHPGPCPRAGLPSLLRDAAGGCQLWMAPVTDAQRTDNVARVLDKFTSLGVLPAQGQVRVLAEGAGAG